MAIHGVSSVSAVKTPTPAAARLLAEKKAQSQNVIDQGTERAREQNNIVAMKRRGSITPNAKKKKNTGEQDLSSTEALKQRNAILAHRLKMYDNTGTAIAVNQESQQKRSVAHYGPYYNYLTAIQNYSNTATVGYQQARKAATVVNLLV